MARCFTETLLFTLENQKMKHLFQWWYDIEGSMINGAFAICVISIAIVGAGLLVYAISNLPDALRSFGFL